MTSSLQLPRRTFLAAAALGAAATQLAALTPAFAQAAGAPRRLMTGIFSFRR